MVVNSSIIIAGGDMDDLHTKQYYAGKVAKYTVENNQFHFLPYVKGLTIMFTMGNTVYVINNTKYGNGDETLSLDLTNTSAGWKLEKTKPSLTLSQQHGRNIVAVINNTSYIFAPGPMWYYGKDVLTWSPGQPQWSKLSQMHVKRQLHCVANDQINSVWVIGGCSLVSECFQGAFIEKYTVSTDSWRKVNATPSIEINTSLKYKFNSVNFCVYWKGMIYAGFRYAFSHCPHRYRLRYNIVCLDPRIHVFNTSSEQWHVSSTSLHTEAIKVMSVVLS